MRQVAVKVRWADEDGNGHVNNAVYLNYLEEARDMVMDDLFGEASYHFVIVHVGIDYRTEITHRDKEIVVESWLTGYGTSSIRTAEVIRRSDGTLAAEAETVMVARDPLTQRSRPLTDAERGILDVALTSETPRSKR